MNEKSASTVRSSTPYLSGLGAWALAFGCSVGWGAFMLPGSTMLPIAGPIGTALGMLLGALAMLVLALNFHFLMNRYPECGGTYAYIKYSFGYDQGFLCAWFLILTYIAIIWANATALPLVFRMVFGDAMQFGFHYQIAGYQIYLGEMLLAVGALLAAALFCLNRRGAVQLQIVMAMLLLVGVTLCFVAAAKKSDVGFSPAYSPTTRPTIGVITVFALTPWAYVGFESISHSAGEAKFPLQNSFRISALAILFAALVYSLLALLSVTALPEGCPSWVEYLFRLDMYGGIVGQPSFFAAHTALGRFGSALLALAALCAIFTGLIGNYIALSRLICALTDDGMLPAWLGRLDQNEVPRNAILTVMAVSVVLPFFGRTAISWIVDVTTVGATIAYLYASAAAWKLGKKQEEPLFIASGIIGLIISALFALVFMIPSISMVKTMSTESYFILAAWGILGFLYFRIILHLDKERRFGRSVIAWVVLFGLIIFSTTIWMRQVTENAIDNSIAPIQDYYIRKLEEAGVDMVTNASKPSFDYLREEMQYIGNVLDRNSLVQTGVIVFALLILFDIYSQIQKRERQIEIEKRIAEEGSRAKTSFLSNMSHEIRTPLNAIIGLDNIALRDPALSPSTRSNLEKIGSSAKHLLGLINDILDMSRIESGRTVLKSEEFSFQELLDQINIMINGQCVDKGLSYDCQIIGKVSEYYFGDAMKLKQVLINILGNSVKFTDPPGNVTLTVEQTAQFEGYCTLRFVMKDTGVGMEKDFIPKIFEAFSQEDDTTTNRYGGSGLGMSITKKFVDMMNGDIHIDSEKGVGSTFTVTVTLKSSGRSFRNEQSYCFPENLRVLVVDNDEISCEAALDLLEAAGIKAETQTDSRKAQSILIDAYRNGVPYDLVLTDYKMPEPNGIDLARSLHQVDGGKTPIVLLTGYNWEDIESEARKAGIQAFLSKPLFSDKLLQTLRNVLGDKIQGADSGDTEQPLEISSILRGKRILMAEDIDQNAEILADLLELEEMESVRAPNGEVAVRLFRESPESYFDAILMDVRMPVMDGLNATREIRKLERADAKAIPIIAMTANVFGEDVERSLQSGMNAHLTKPIEPEHLYNTMAKYIAEYREKKPNRR